MPVFNYVALDARGQESIGALEALSSSEVVSQLRQAGYFPTSVVEEGKGGPATKKMKKAVKTASKSPAASKASKGMFARSTVKEKS